MSNIIPFRNREDFEIDQRLEAIESRMAYARQFKDLSQSQRDRLIATRQIDVKDAFGKIYLEAASAYIWASKEF